MLHNTLIAPSPDALLPLSTYPTRQPKPHSANPHPTHQLTPHSPTHTPLTKQHPTSHSPIHTPLTNSHPTRQLTPHSPTHTPLDNSHPTHQSTPHIPTHTPTHQPTLWVPHPLTVIGCGVESSQDTTLITSTCARACIHRSPTSRGGGVVSAICQL